jgi:hypothetical protein
MQICHISHLTGGFFKKNFIESDILQRADSSE